MPGCDMCGADSSLLRAIIENVELKVCTSCSKFGRVVGPAQPPRAFKKKEKFVSQSRPEIVESVIKNYSSVIQQKRFSMGMNQKEFAQKVNEKESVIHGLENGSFKPSLELARKLEKFLGISLVEVEDDEFYEASTKKAEGMTLGDFIKIKKSG